MSQSRFESRGKRARLLGVEAQAQLARVAPELILMTADKKVQQFERFFSSSAYFCRRLGDRFPELAEIVIVAQKGGKTLIS